MPIYIMSIFFNLLSSRWHSFTRDKKWNTFHHVQSWSLSASSRIYSFAVFFFAFKSSRILAEIHICPMRNYALIPIESYNEKSYVAAAIYLLRYSGRWRFRNDTSSSFQCVHRQCCSDIISIRTHFSPEDEKKTNISCDFLIISKKTSK